MVNINDMKGPEALPTEITKAIFAHQKELALKYVEIEGMGNLLNEKNNIQTKTGQLWIKEFAWRVTEELAEALEPIVNSDYEPTKEQILHYKEELADALHFFVEMCIIAGYDEKCLFQIELKQDWKEYSEDCFDDMETAMYHWDVVYHLGLMCNTLKNKRWKQTQMLTDEKTFIYEMQYAWDSLINCFMAIGMKPEDIYNFYFRKNAVNQFRQRSKY